MLSMAGGWIRWWRNPRLIALIGAAVVLCLPILLSAAPDDDPAALLARGRAAMVDGDFQAAAELLLPALQQFEQKSNLSGVAAAAGELLVCQMQLGQIDQAEWTAGQGRNALEQLGDLAGAAQMTANFATILRSWGEYELAAEQLKLAYSLYIKASDIKGQAGTRLAQGIIADLLGDLATASGYFAAARVMFHDLGDRGSEAMCFVNEGYAQYRLGNLEESLFAYQQAVYLYQRLGSKLELARTFSLSAMTYRGMDLLDDAAREYEMAALLFFDEGAKDEAANAYYELGLTLGYAGRSEKALVYLDHAWSIWEELGAIASLRQELTDLQVVLRDLDRGKEIELYQERLAKLENGG